MPFYLYIHPETGDQVEVFQGMKEKHEFVDNEGTQWKRVFTVPQASMDTKIDPFSSHKFIEKTSNEGTMGDLYDRSREWHEKRKDTIHP